MIKKFNYVENDTHIFLLILGMRACVCCALCMQENDVRVCLCVQM